MIESNNLGTIILEPREGLRIHRGEERWNIKQRFHDGPMLMINLDDTKPDNWFFWCRLNNQRWITYKFDPKWIGPDGRWVSHEYEYLGRELVLQKNGILPN